MKIEANLAVMNTTRSRAGLNFFLGLIFTFA